MLRGKSRKELQKLRITPGSIVHAFCPYLPTPKNKFVVIAYENLEEDLILGFFINSRIHPLTESNKDKKICQVTMPVSTYTFLDGDSFLDCSEVRNPFGHEELAGHLANYPNDHKGVLAEKELVEILQIVKSSRAISNKDRECILSSLGEIDVTRQVN